MKKRFLHILFLFLLFSNGVFAQLNLGGEEKYKALTETMKRLDDALIAKNSFELDKILSDELKMTHSNGMVETKQDLIDHINKGYLEYKSIKQLKLQDKNIIGEKNARTVRLLDVTGIVDGEEFDVKLMTFEDWRIGEDGNWQLIKRESKNRE